MNFGTQLAAYRGDDPIGDLSEDFLCDCRVKGIDPSSIETGEEMRNLMGYMACTEALEALDEACELFGDPYRYFQDDEGDEDDEEDEEEEE